MPCPPSSHPPFVLFDWWFDLLVWLVIMIVVVWIQSNALQSLLWISSCPQLLFLLFFGRICLPIWAAPCGILVPRSGMEPECPALGGWRLNRWTTRDVPAIRFNLARLFSSFLQSVNSRFEHCWDFRGGFVYSWIFSVYPGKSQEHLQFNPVNSYFRSFYFFA